MITILNLEPRNYSEEARAVLDGLGRVIDGPFPDHELSERLGEADVVIVRLGVRVDRAFVDASPRLRAIVSATTGLDHIDTAACDGRGIRVLSLQGEDAFLGTVSATAEMTWALLLALARRLPAAASAAAAGNWDRDQFRGIQLRGKRLGIVGLGRLGRMVATYAQAFDMPVAAVDPFADDWMAGVERSADVKDLAAGVDFLSLHVPLNEETRHMIGESVLSALPATAFLINTARGGLINEAALLRALEEKRIAGAALDVVGGELDRDGDRLNSPVIEYARHNENLILTPHLGGATEQSMAATEVFMATKLARFLEEGGMK